MVSAFGYATMQLALGLALWVLVIVGGVPARTQRALEGRLSWWHSRLFGLASAVLESLSGWGLLRNVLLMSGLGLLSSAKAWILGTIATLLLLEGLVRLAVMSRLKDGACPSLPVVLVARAFPAVSVTG